jgi:competence protein ComEA
MSEFVARVRDRYPRGAAVMVVVAALAAGVLWYRAGASAPGADIAGALPPPVEASPAPVATTTTAPVAFVHVAGAVARPGLYRLAGGARVADALEAAGGPRPRADLDRLNLAARVVDGQRVAVPRRGEPPPPGPAGDGPGPGGDPGDAGHPPAAPVDLNTAGQAELETLPGVGPATARRILDERSRRGGFTSVRDLLGVPGIGERRFAELRDRVRV